MFPFPTIGSRRLPNGPGARYPTAGTTNAAANQALNSLKQDLRRVKNGKIQCDGKSLGIFNDSMQSRMACIERQMDGTAEAGLSQAKCKNTLKMVTDRLNNKLRVLAASAGYPVQKRCNCQGVLRCMNT